MTTSWADLIDRYGSDPDQSIRSQVAVSGAIVTGYLFEEKERKLAVKGRRRSDQQVSVVG